MRPTPTTKRYRMLTYTDDGQQIVKVLHDREDGVYWSPIYWSPQEPPTRTSLKNAEEESLKRWNVTQQLYSLGVRLVDPELGASLFYPRVARNDPGQRVPSRRERNWFIDEFPDVWRSTNVALAHLSSMLEDIFRTVEPAPRNAECYGHALRHLLILACNEVEAAWKGILTANGYSARAEKSWNTEDYVKLRRPMRLDEWAVALDSYPSWGERSPFSAWDETRATQSLAWYSAYNAVKHNREVNLEQARLDHVIDAVAAATIMLHAQFGPEVEPYATTALARFRIQRSPTWAAPEMYYGPPPRQPVPLSL